mgnify:CR=1 FL=1
MEPILEVDFVTKHFGGLVAVRDVSFTVKRGEILGLIGPNGAGKTTLLNLICGVYKPDKGKIKFKGEDITALKPHQICEKGIGRTLQIPHAFPELSTVENITLPMLFLQKDLKGKEAEDRALKILEFVGFPRDKYYVPASNLNTLDLKYLQLARALASNPELLVLDEVTTGLNPTESKKAIELIRKIRENGITILLVEHVMRIVVSVCDRVIVLSSGQKIIEGKPQEVMRNRQVIELYLGEKFRMEG